MRERNAFSGMHPIVQIVFFLAVSVITAMIRNPVYLGISLAFSLAYAVYCGRRKFLRYVGIVLLFSVLVGLLNPLFNHRGATILFYLPDGNPFTLESLVFGGLSAMMTASVIFWCAGMRYTIQSDGIIWLFGKIAPRIGLFFSMVLRFVPELIRRSREIRNAQHMIGRDSNSTIFRRIKNSADMVSSLVGITLEDSVDTADSLYSRGYGLKHRTSYSVFRFTFSDGAALVFILACAGLSAAGFFCGLTDFECFPVTDVISLAPYQTMLYTVFAGICALPLIIILREEVRWKHIQSET